MRDDEDSVEWDNELIKRAQLTFIAERAGMVRNDDCGKSDDAGTVADAALTQHA